MKTPLPPHVQRPSFPSAVAASPRPWHPVGAISGGIFFIFAAVAGFPAQGAVVIFGSAQTISGDSDISTAGTLDRAYNFGTSGVTEATVNGVTFASGGTGFNQPVSTFGTAPATTELAAVGGNTNSNTGAFGSTSAPFSSLSSGYQSLLNSAIFFDSPGGVMALTLNGLSIGAQYEIQLFVNDSRSLAASRTNTISDPDAPGNSVVLSYNFLGTDGGLGQFVLGTFTADEESERIEILGNTSAQISAMQLRVLVPVPEPTTWVLLGAAGVTILLLRRPRRA